MKHVLFGSLTVLIMLSVLVLTSRIAHTQTCAQLGHYTYCDTPSGARIQSDLGHNRGVIIGPRETTPYVILRPSERSVTSETPRSPIFVPYGSRTDLSLPLMQHEAMEDPLGMPPLPFPE